MPKGYSLHIAVNQSDPAHYGPNLKPLRACLNDADNMAQLAAHSQFQQIKILFDHEATHADVIGQINDYAQQAKAGDLVFISYSGHGSQIPVLNPGNDSDEDDDLDETWCLFDTQLIDTELYNALTKFEKDVRVAVILDSCHSGTAVHEWIHESWAFLEDFLNSREQRFRHVSESLREKLFKKHRTDFEKRQQEMIDRGGRKMQASICLMSACQDNQRAIEDLHNGRFTSAILFEVDNQHTYRSLHKKIHKHLHAFQSPNLYTLGPKTNQMLKLPFMEV
jgi:hypothetical protein